MLFTLVLAAGSLSGQDSGESGNQTPNPEDLGDQALNTQVVELVNENEFLEARPFLLEMKKRMEEQEDGAQEDGAQEDKERMEPISFFLASSYLQEYQETDDKDALQTAVESFEEYIEEFPEGPRKTIARLNLGDAYSDLKEYDKAIEVYEAIYDSPS
ncbi:MAG: tetratricopeptide repeat protein, partial [Opitutales bacterium]